MSNFEIGVLITLFTLVRAFLFIPFGKLSDRLGHRPVILFGITGAALISAGISLAQGYLALAFLIFLMAVCESLVYPAVVSGISKSGEGGNSGLVMGIFNAVAMVGWAVFPGVGGPLADSFGPAAPFLIFAIVGLAFVPILLKLLKD
jgi:DHA2 family multidrug resistance protein-like MFS transporter